MIVADTNVVSELMRPHPDHAVAVWSETFGRGDVAITAITVEEIERGIGRLSAGRRREDLARRWRAVLEGHGDAVLAYDDVAARRTAHVLVTAEAMGRPMGLADAETAGICLAVGAELATRNVRDFSPVVGLTVVDPWQS